MQNSTIKYNNFIRAFISIVIMAWSLYYLWEITFIEEGAYLSQYTGEILGFTMGTSVSTILGHYFSGIRSLPSDKRRKADYTPNGDGNGDENPIERRSDNVT